VREDSSGTAVGCGEQIMAKRCTFCGTEEHRRGQVIKGYGGAICSDCMLAATSLLAGQPMPLTFVRRAAPGDLSCRFCMGPPRTSLIVSTSGEAGICDHCLEFAEAVTTEYRNEVSTYRN
jgi:hypothetical protein